MLCLSPFSEDKFHARFFLCPAVPYPAHRAVACSGPRRPHPAQFLPFSAEAFQQARTRDVPVLLFISDAPPTLSDAALSMQIAERTVPVWLYPGMRPDVELLCQRAGALFSEEGALPLCALMLEDARVFLAAPLPPAGFRARSVSAVRLALAGRPPLRAEPRRFHPSGRADPSLVPRRTAA